MENKRGILAEDLYTLELISEPRISPDGQKVVFVKHRIDQNTQKKYSNLWIIPADGGAPQQYTFGDQNETHPRWSPDGNFIAFLSNREDKDKPPQIYLLPTQGGEARCLTDIKGEIIGFSWSPRGNQLLCSIRKTDQEVIDRDKDEQKKKLGVVLRQYDRVFYKLDGYGYLPKERVHIWMVDADSGTGKQLTDSSVFDEEDPEFSPDGCWIVFKSNRHQNPDFFPDRSDIYLISEDGNNMREFNLPIGEKGLPSFSPDGKWVAYYASEGEGLGYKNYSLWVIPSDGSSKPVNLTEKYDLHTSGWTINDVGQPETMKPTWSNDSQSIYFQVVHHGNTVLMSISKEGNNLKTLIGDDGVVSAFTFDNEQDRMAYFYGTMTDPGQVFCLDVPSGRNRQLTQLNHTLFAEIDLGRVEEVWFKGSANNDLQGWIIKPPDFDPKIKYPSIMEIHGGPLTQYGNFFMHEFYYLASQGYVVYFCNPRGGRGYGEEHAKAIWGSWGDADYADLMAWADYVKSLPYINAEKMGVTGGSYGGYMTVWIIGHTPRFKAAVTQRCVSNFISMWGSSDFNWVFQQELSNRPPFEDLQKYWDHSPMKYIGNAKTPTLVIHNEMDLRCPIEQGEQVFVALKSLGVDSEMIRFPDEFHGLSRGGRTDRRIARLNHILRWFDKYLKD